METFEKTLEKFLKELSTFAGRTPVVKIDYQEQTIYVVDSPSSFIKQLCNSEGAMTSLSKKGLRVEYFAR